MQTVKITFTGNEYDQFMSMWYGKEDPTQPRSATFLTGVLKARGIIPNELVSYALTQNPLEIDVNYLIYENYFEAFKKYVVGQKVVNTYWEDPEYRKRGGMFFVYENGYIVVSHGGGSSGFDYNEVVILGPDGYVVAKFENEGI